MAKIFSRVIQRFHFPPPVNLVLCKELCIIPLITPSKCTIRPILNNQVPFTSKHRENVAYLAFAVNRHPSRLIISSLNQLRLEMEQMLRSATFMVFLKSMEPEKQMFTSAQTTVVARTTITTLFGTGAGVWFMVCMKTLSILSSWRVTPNLARTGALASWTKSYGEHSYLLCLISLRPTTSQP